MNYVRNIKTRPIDTSCRINSLGTYNIPDTCITINFWHQTLSEVKIKTDNII